METKTILIAMVAVFALACSKDDSPAPGPVEKSGEKQMVSFVFRAGDNAALQTDVFAILNDSVKAATASLPHGTDVKALLPDITVSEKASVVPKGAKDFTDPVTYIVTAEDGSEAIYKASANTAPSDKKQLWDFRFLASKNNALVQDVVAEIDQGKKTVAAKMPAGTEITALEPSVDIPSGAIQEPEGPQDFTEPVRYTITAADGSSSTYTVTLTVPLTEKDILLKIIAINPQLNFRSWTAENNISDFRGVEVDNNGRVNELVILDKRLIELPPEIGQLSHLETLELVGNLSSLPPEIGQLVHLKDLQLYSNILSSIPSEIGRLTSLEYLELSDNVLTLLPSEMGQLTQLQFLGLDKNDISEFPMVVGQLKNLKELRLSHNKISTLPPEIGLMTGLEELWLVDNVLSGLPVEIGQLSKLEELNLGDNSLETLPPEIWQLTLLQKLVVNDNRITSLPPEIEQLIRLQRLDFRNNSLTTLPHPEQIIFTPASVNDLALYKQAWAELPGRTFFGDKIYNDKGFFRDMSQRFGSEMLTPVKAVKGMSEVLKKFDRAANDLYSKAVSKIRQPIESLFNWLIEKADIQKASKVRSTKGLTLHAYGRLAAAFITLIF